MLSKLNTVIWYLRQPKLYGHFLYQLYQFFLPHRRENTREEATSWCAGKATSTAEAIHRLTGYAAVDAVSRKFGTELDLANKAAAQAPVKMGGGSDIDLLFYLVRYLQPNVVIETGVAYGWSSLAILLALDELKQGRLYSTDIPYAKLNNEDFVGIVVPEALKHRWTLLKAPDRAGLKKILILEDKINLVHYDSDKSYRGRQWAYKLLWNHLETGGILMSDDINDNLGFKDFSESIGVKPLIVYHKGDDKYIGILKKI